MILEERLKSRNSFKTSGVNPRDSGPESHSTPYLFGEDSWRGLRNPH